ncbi:uncharacterized protein LOC111248747 isoform X1 [Varroa destructor]|uniref:Uncharacterized protein n=2 Tax=Varroa TaxID=62624 RepID=A0A7M7JV28_VARDE|nr:uncharacterized protein LOC111248747 isoform X1 [Varroa destructor]XP_022657353.1 uncharacterized protein LOC111248747 isoform X1 [Varroa destructor]XP_022657354.1 uncharacterized protein LOC111248747 isoform X1 [Varroa destructor]
MVSKICPSVNGDPSKEPPAALQYGNKILPLLVFTDVLFCQFVVSPLVISHWAYVWELAEATGRNFHSAGICALIGFIILICASVAQFWLKRHAVSKRGNAVPLFAKFYLISTSFASIVSWRGVWSAMDLQFGTDLTSCAYTFVLGVGILLSMGGLKTAAASPPFLTLNDDVLRLGGAVYDFPTRFSAKNVLGLMLDSGFSVIVPTVGVVGLWRALWIPQDLYIIFEDDPTHFRSNAISCVLGWGSTLILLAFQVPMDKVCVKLEHRLNWWARFSVESLWSFLQICATVLLWRGIWNFSLIYLEDWFPETPLLHVKITLTCATLLLLLGFSIYSNSAAKGCVSDGYGIGYFISFFGAIPEVALRQPQDHTLLTSYK